MILCTQKEIELKNDNDLITCYCDNCEDFFHIKNSKIRIKLNNVRMTKISCSITCYNKHKTLTIKEECAQCKEFFILKIAKKLAAIGGNNFCSKKCVDLFPKNPGTNKTRKRSGTIPTNCGWCQKPIKVIVGKLKASKSGFCFCNNSCATTYMNVNNPKGTNRSKLEYYIEEQITINYPTLKADYNKKDTIGYELDIYLPELKLAIELNGIFHCELLSP